MIFLIINPYNYTLHYITIIMSDKDLLIVSIRYNNIEQTMNLLNNYNPLKTLYSTSLFKYNSFEFIFFKGSPEMIFKLISSDIFKLVNQDHPYSKKNKKIYKTVGEYYIQSVLSRLFNEIELSRSNLRIWLKIFSYLVERGFVNNRTNILVNKYILQPKMPKILRTIIKIIILLDRQKKNKLIYNTFYPGIDKIICDYMIY